jgi:predicted ATP-grasp superfamily ATP-dependent carboligase
LRKRLSALLASGSYSGTIAAVRNLSANGISVNVVSSRLLSGAAWSRWTSARHSAPPETSSGRFIERLLEIGKANPGQILLPTSDETAWLYAANADILGRWFCLYQPSLPTIHNILDKKLFEVAASRAGLLVLPSWYPRSIAELKTVMPNLPYPILIKRRTQVQGLWPNKGTIAYSPEDLICKYNQFVDRERTRARDDNPLLLEAHTPMLQQFVKVGKEGVLSVTGFIDQTGVYFVTRYSAKVLQRSHPVGIGLCFESMSDVSVLSDAVRRLCNDLGYFGIFEIEFVFFNGSWAAIDFNPRLFHQLGMDIRRGMPLPLLACLDAAGESKTLRETVAKTQTADENRKIVFCDRFLLGPVLLARRLNGQMSPEDRLYWRSWRKRNAAYTVDAAADKTDLIPGVIHALAEISSGKILPRFLRLMPLPILGFRRTAPQ